VQLSPLIRLCIFSQISELELKLENAGESTALNEMLEDATRRVEDLQFDIKGKNAEVTHSKYSCSS
jgi:hypothetical protein